MNVAITGSAPRTAVLGANQMVNWFSARWPPGSRRAKEYWLNQERFGAMSPPSAGIRQLTPDSFRSGRVVAWSGLAKDVRSREFERHDRCTPG